MRWAAGEAEKWRPEDESGQPVEQADNIIDVIERIDEVLSMDAMSWSPMSESEKARILAGEQDERPREWIHQQIHAIPMHQVSEWATWWDGLSEADQNDTPWFVVCFTCGAVGEREVSCGCGNPSSSKEFR
ncbi:hypothetical protein [Mycobacteroides abscessus]|uniref:hypothetical protein n=1 Tax=Mycobacteroides abscessus TaxID=36809 RepID=UPI0010560A04|nr:hypothetical protein [Mycobacteroides abscessus]